MKIIGLCLVASAAFASAELERAVKPAHNSDPRRLQERARWGRQRQGWRKDSYFGRNLRKDSYFGRNWRKENWGGNNNKDGGKEDDIASWGKEEEDNKPGSQAAADKDEADWGAWNGSGTQGENDKEHSDGWGANDKDDDNNWNKPEGTWSNNDKEHGNNWSDWSGSDNWSGNNWGDNDKEHANDWSDGDDKPGEGGWNWSDNDKEDGNNWSGADNWSKPDSGWGGSNNDKEDGNNWSGADNWSKPDSGWGGKPDNNGGDNDGGKPDWNDEGNNHGGKPNGDNGGGAINPGSFVNLSDLGSPGQFNVRVRHGGMDREFLIYVPESYNSAQSVPLLFNFHGFGGSMNGYLVGDSVDGSADMRPVADAENFILVYPQGSTLPTSNSPHWNSSPVGGDNKSTADDIGFVSQMIDQIASVYSVDTSRVYAAGYSNGGGMAYYLGCDLSQRIAGIASVASSGPVQGCNPLHPMPMISLHGTTDGVIPYNGGNGWNGARQSLEFWVNFNGAQTPAVITTDRSSGMTIERSVFAAGRSGVSIEHYRYMNGGHVWFMNNFQGRTTGQLIWDYLSQFSLDNLSN